MPKKEVMPVVEEHRLIQMAKEGDTQALKQLVKAHLPRIRGLVGKVCWQRGCRHLFDDLVDQGQQELRRVIIERFDFSKAHSERAASHNMTRLWTFALPRVNGEILNFLEREGVIRIPRGKQNRVSQLETISRRLQQELEREPTDGEVAREMDMSVDDLHALLSMPQLYENVDEIGESLKLSSQRQTWEAQAVEEEEKQELAELMMAAIEQLPPKQKEAIKLATYADCSLKEIAARTGVQENTIKKRLHDARKNLAKNQALQQLYDRRVGPKREQNSSSDLKLSSQTGGEKDA